MAIASLIQLRAFVKKEILVTIAQADAIVIHEVEFARTELMGLATAFARLAGWDQIAQLALMTSIRRDCAPFSAMQLTLAVDTEHVRLNAAYASAIAVSQVKIAMFVTLTFILVVVAIRFARRTIVVTTAFAAQRDSNVSVSTAGQELDCQGARLQISLF
jgi:hypothetical protein